jgi:hypothetical protein
MAAALPMNRCVDRRMNGLKSLSTETHKPDSLKDFR